PRGSTSTLAPTVRWPMTSRLVVSATSTETPAPFGSTSPSRPSPRRTAARSATSAASTLAPRGSTAAASTTSPAPTPCSPAVSCSSEKVKSIASLALRLPSLASHAQPRGSNDLALHLVDATPEGVDLCASRRSLHLAGQHRARLPGADVAPRTEDAQQGPVDV